MERGVFLEFYLVLVVEYFNEDKKNSDFKFIDLIWISY